jgi:endonuclease/exonuclease/phosphatase family metal-dependent hydrolase
MKFITCNIEGDRHLAARLLPFFKQEAADVLCLQEVFAVDLPLLEAATSLRSIFVPQAQITQVNPHLPARGDWGVAILAPEFVSWQAENYIGTAAVVPEFFANNDPNSMNRVLLSAQVKVAGEVFQIATTHFTWSGEGVVNDEQRRAYAKLTPLLEGFEELIFCGDLNTPRGYELWDDLAKRYSDNIPSEIDTTVDRNLHKSGFDIRLVIDGLFTSQAYTAKQVRVVPNTSDHMAVVAEVKRS